MTPLVEETDVLIVGCGPVGALTANLLGLYGVRTLVLERELTEHGQPRAITCDDEALRIYQSAGLAEPLDAHMHTCPEVELVGASGELFARLVVEGLDFGLGYPVLRFFSQPYVEHVLRQGLSRFPHVSLRLGQRVESFTQEAHSISATVQDTRTGAERTVRARYLLACDGGSRPVRASPRRPARRAPTVPRLSPRTRWPRAGAESPACVPGSPGSGHGWRRTACWTLPLGFGDLQKRRGHGRTVPHAVHCSEPPRQVSPRSEWLTALTSAVR
jgi:2-polyprenyl-6-methoxyphenol hydroxylase-like FAD-dependent oxidoreductase